MSLSIRKASMDDLDAVTQLESHCFPPEEAASTERFQERLSVFREQFWLLENEGRLIGMLNGMISNEKTIRDEMFEDAALHDPHGDWQMIFGLMTEPVFQRQGYAALLMETAISECKRNGRKGMVLTCKEALIPYYEKFGYVNEGVSGSVHGGAVWYDMRLTF